MLSRWPACLILASSFVLTACQPAAPEAATLRMQQAWVRAPMPGRSMTAGYVQISNGRDKPRTINAVRSAQFERVELHETTSVDGEMRMREIKTLLLPAGDTVALEPGGAHLMLIGAKTAIAEGDSVTVSFSVDDGSRIDLTMPVMRRNPNEQ